MNYCQWIVNFPEVLNFKQVISRTQPVHLQLFGFV